MDFDIEEMELVSKRLVNLLDEITAKGNPSVEDLEFFLHIVNNAYFPEEYGDSYRDSARKAVQAAMQRPGDQRVIEWLYKIARTPNEVAGLATAADKYASHIMH